jgi:hypothetical protein
MGGDMSTISAGNTASTAITVTGDTTGNLVFQTQAGTNTITVPNTTGTLALYAAPQITTYTSGSGTYTVPTGAKYLYLKMVGGGAGGQGSNNNASTSPASGAGGNTTFGSSLLTASGGGAVGAQQVGAGGAGGSATINSPATGLAIAGGRGGPTIPASDGVAGVYNAFGGPGGITAFGGAPNGSTYQGAGLAGATNSGGGGSGASVGGNQSYAGGGGGGGGYVEAYITSSLDATYSYAVGAGGTAGAAGTGGSAGGAGGSGVIIITAFFG